MSAANWADDRREHREPFGRDRVCWYRGRRHMGTQSKSALVRMIRSIALLTTTAAVIALSGVTAAEAATVTLKVVKAGTATPVGDYKYLINVDNTGTTTQRSPAPRPAATRFGSGLPGQLHVDLDRRRARLEPDLHTGRPVGLPRGHPCPGRKVSRFRACRRLQARRQAFHRCPAAASPGKARRQVIRRAKSRLKCSRSRSRTRRSRQQCSRTFRRRTVRPTFPPSTAWPGSRLTSSTTWARSPPTSMADRSAEQASA